MDGPIHHSEFELIYPNAPQTTTFAGDGSYKNAYGWKNAQSDGWLLHSPI